MADLDQLFRDLVTSNHILAREGVTDSLGHVSVRHPDRPDRFFLSCSDQRDRPMYFERAIHGAIYQVRPDVMSVVHNHAYETIPFGLTKRPLRVCVHPACGMGTHVGVWDIRDAFGDTDILITNMERGKHLAKSLGQDNTMLLARHGCVVAGESLKIATLNAVYFKINASLLLNAINMGGEITYLSPGEIELTKKLVYSDNAVQRMWGYWSRRCGDTK
jgi:ribulose-5-phosphate 4-epimerase/fuculose-1-phosphate aldolase